MGGCDAKEGISVSKDLRFGFDGSMKKMKKG